MTKDKSIFIKNIYYMLSYAFTVLRHSHYADIETEKFEHIHNLFAAILSKGIAQQLKHGLYREYRSVTEEMPALRGKIQMTGTIRSRIAQKRTLTCEYDELSENNLYNQILKTTVFLLLRHAQVDEIYKVSLKKAMLYFSGIDTIAPASIRWSSIRFHRNHQNYQMLIGICQLIIEGMLQTTEQGEHRLAAFVDEQHMCRLYEKFILEYYRRHYPQLKANASRIAWALDDGFDTMLPAMQSDIMLTCDEKTLIIDAKYYGKTTQTQYGVHTLHSNNLYQIFAYVKNLAAAGGEVSGMLLYARTNETVQPDQNYWMNGNRIGVKTLDLNCTFTSISEQLNSVANAFLGS